MCRSDRILGNDGKCYILPIIEYQAAKNKHPFWKDNDPPGNTRFAMVLSCLMWFPRSLLRVVQLLALSTPNSYALLAVMAFAYGHADDQSYKEISADDLMSLVE
jgi:hypothetical protein